jgi:hypothetical protein
MPTPRFILLLLGMFCLTFELQAGYSSPRLPLFGGTRRVLLLGDSLTVGPFGREMQAFLCEELTEKRVFIYASCGSSPENWLENEPTFVSKCGSRVKTPASFTHGEFDNGHPPEPFTTPKIQPLLEQIRPAAVLVQLGTNWFDRLEQNAGPEQLAKLGAFLDGFVDAVQNAPGRPMLIWITPPDSSRFRRVQDSVTKLIISTAKRRRFAVIDSSSLVRYEAGKTGGDGVHYSSEAAAQWAEGVIKRLQNLL